MHTVRGKIFETNNYMWLVLPDEYIVNTSYYYNSERGSVVKKDGPSMTIASGSMAICAHCPKRSYPVFEDMPLFNEPNQNSDILYFAVSVQDEWEPAIITVAKECNININVHMYAPTVMFTKNNQNRRVITGEYVYRKSRKKQVI